MWMVDWSLSCAESHGHQRLPLGSHGCNHDAEPRLLERFGRKIHYGRLRGCGDTRFDPHDRLLVH